jgi:hypothetical protein
MSGRVRGVRVFQGLALLLVASALGFGQSGCDDGPTWECVNDNVTCDQAAVDETACSQRAYCTLGSACQATACASLDEAACEAKAVCAWSEQTPGVSSCGFSTNADECEQFSSPSECAAQTIGCSWQPACVLKPRDCSNIDDQASCEARPACKWQEGTGRFYLG